MPITLLIFFSVRNRVSSPNQNSRSGEQRLPARGSPAIVMRKLIFSGSNILLREVQSFRSVS